MHCPAVCFRLEHRVFSPLCWHSCEPGYPLLPALVQNPLKPTGYFTYHQVPFRNSACDYFAFVFFVWISEQTVTFALYIINRLLFITEAEGAVCAVRTESLYIADKFLPWRVNLLPCFVVRLLCANERRMKKHVNAPSDKKAVMLGRNMLRPNVNETLIFRTLNALMSILWHTTWHWADPDCCYYTTITNYYYYYYYYVIVVIVFVVVAAAATVVAAAVVSCQKPFLPDPCLLGSIPDGVIGIFHWHNPSGRAMSLELTQPLTEMSTRSISWG